MIAQTCEFETPRLRVGPWHSVELPNGQGLAGFVCEALTAGVTSTLPAAWHGSYTPERASAWITERDQEGATLLVLERVSNEPVGLLMAFEAADGRNSDLIAVRLGYLLRESAWGRGLASELVAGFVSWCRSQPAIRSIAGGVELGNVASTRVLSKNGFVPVESSSRDSADQTYELTFHR